VLFVISGIDKPDSGAIRQANRADHAAYWTSMGDALVLAGPYLDEMDRMVGSLIIVDVDKRDAAEALLAGDPYTRAGLFEDVGIRRWAWALNKPEGR
jgi:uncharacterized protein